MSGLLLALAMVAAQDHHMMPGMAMPAASRAPTKGAPKARRRPLPARAEALRPATSMAGGCSAEHAVMGHCTMAPADPVAPVEPVMTCPPEHAAMGHCTPSATAATPAPEIDSAPDPACPPDHAAMGHCTPAPARAVEAAGTDLPAGSGAPPPAPTRRAADAFYAPAAMARADRQMRREHGGMMLSQVIFNLAEVQVRQGRDGYRWDGEGWFGGDINRLVVKTEGEGGFGDRVEAAEVQALYARAIDPYWNLQAGVRQDLGAGARRTWAVVGVEGLAPYWFDVEGALFLSDRGDLTARAEAWYDQRITQRLIAQPRVEFNLSAQDMPGSGVGAGLSSAEAGLRLRYEIAREFAPYVGVSWERRYGATARFAQARGEGTGGVALVLGVRGWF